MVFQPLSSLRGRLILLVLSAVLPAFLLILSSVFEHRRGEAKHAEREALEMAKTVADGHRAMSSSVRQLLISLAGMTEVPDAASGGPCNRMLAGILRFNPDIANVGVLRMNGDLVCSALPFDGPANSADRAYFQRTVASGEFSVGDFQVSRLAGKRVVGFGYPLFDADRKMWGVVFAQMDLDRLNRLLVEIDHPEGASLQILDSAGTLIEHHPDPEKWVGKSVADLPLFRQIQGTRNEGIVDGVGLDGVRRIFAFTPLFSQPRCCAYAVAGIPAATVYAEANQDFRRDVVLMAALAVLVLALAWFGGSFFVLKPVNALVRAARRMGRGDLGARSGVPHSEGELGQLARSFDEMADSLQAWQEQVRQSAQAIEKLGRRNQLILDSVGEGIYGVDMQGRVTFVNPAGAQMLGYPAPELVGKSLHETVHYKRPNGDPYPVEECPHHMALVEGVACTGCDETIWRKDGSGFVTDYMVAPVVEGGEITGAVISFRDITERKRYEEQLAYQATHDTLTGLANRTILTDRLNLLIERAGREGDVVALLLFDLDRFKEINDSLGHGAGDELLRAVARRLGALMRESDTVARLGGDEFVMLAEMEEADNAISFAQRIFEAMRLPFTIAGRELFATASIGISLFPRDGRGNEDLLKNAEVAMYRAKKRGRNTLRFYDESMNASSVERISMESRLRRAVDNGELLLHYQPQVSLRSGEIVGAEALIRWQHPEMGLVSPARFIPLAEESGLIFPVGEWVLRAACGQIRAWRDAGLRPPVIAVNLSAHQFRKRNLVGLATGAVLDSGLDGRYLELEMTESAVMEDADRVIKILRELKEAKFAISIDDFGTGYSSLSYLKQFAIDKLKVDQSFVRDITTDPDDAAITQAIIAMAHGLGLKVIAEGVETAGQLDFLRGHDCDEMQGYFFSRPVPAGEFGAMLREGRKLELAGEDQAGAGRTLLVVDDEPNITAALKRLFHREGYQVLEANGAREGFELLASHPVGVILSDQGMPEVSGIEFLSRVRRLYPDAVCMMLSGHADLGIVTEAFNRGAIYRYIAKPWEDDELRKSVREAFGEYEARRPRFSR